MKTYTQFVLLQIEAARNAATKVCRSSYQKKEKAFDDIEFKCSAGSMPEESSVCIQEASKAFLAKIRNCSINHYNQLKDHQSQLVQKTTKAQIAPRSDKSGGAQYKKSDELLNINLLLGLHIFGLNEKAHIREQLAAGITYPLASPLFLRVSAGIEVEPDNLGASDNHITEPPETGLQVNGLGSVGIVTQTRSSLGEIIFNFDVGKRLTDSSSTHDKLIIGADLGISPPLFRNLFQVSAGARYPSGSRELKPYLEFGADLAKLFH